MQDKRRKMTTDDRQMVTRSELVVVHGLEAPIALPNGGEVVELAVLPDGRRDRLIGELRAVRLAVLANGTMDVVALPVAQVRRKRQRRPGRQREDGRARCSSTVGLTGAPRACAR